MKRLRTIVETIAVIPFVLWIAWADRNDPLTRELDRLDREELDRVKARQRARREYRPW